MMALRNDEEFSGLYGQCKGPCGTSGSCVVFTMSLVVLAVIGVKIAMALL